MKRDLRILPELRLAQKGTCSDGHRLLCNEERLRSVPVRGRRETRVQARLLRAAA